MVDSHYSKCKRHTVTLDDAVYSRLRISGKFGESFSQLISRILDDLQSKELVEYDK